MRLSRYIGGACDPLPAALPRANARVTLRSCFHFHFVPCSFYQHQKQCPIQSGSRQSRADRFKESVFHCFLPLRPVFFVSSALDILAEPPGEFNVVFPHFPFESAFGQCVFLADVHAPAVCCYEMQERCVVFLARFLGHGLDYILNSPLLCCRQFAVSAAFEVDIALSLIVNRNRPLEPERCGAFYPIAIILLIGFPMYLA